MISAAGIIHHIQVLLTQPDSWLQKGYAQDKDGNKVSALDEAACRFCILGALHHSKTDLRVSILDKEYQRAFRAMNHVARLRGFSNMEVFNDSPNTAHDDVLDLLDIAETKALIDA